VGGVSAARRAEIEARVADWAEAAGGGAEGLHFEQTLTTAEREFVHQVRHALMLAGTDECLLLLLLPIVADARTSLSLI